MAGDGKDKKRSLTAVQIQQEYYETIGDADWNLFEEKDRKCLLQNVAIALCGAPTEGGNLLKCVEQVNNTYTLQGYEKRDTESCMTVFNKILEKAKYSHNEKNLLISILRIVCVVPDEVPLLKKTPPNHWIDLHRKTGDDIHIYVFHVFSIRKCLPRTSGGKGCKIYIDHAGRVYKSWESYLKENVLPKCVMVVPRNGEYRGECPEYGDDRTPVVKLTIVGSPALGTAAAVVSGLDTASTVANAGALATALGAGAAALTAPAWVPALATTALGIGTVTGVYAIGRSVGNLIDRSDHEQSIGLGDSEARAAWLTILISSVGITSSAATKLLSWAARSGTNIKILMTAVQYLSYSNLATGAIGVSNGLWEMSYKYAKYRETPTVTELFQFTTSALFLGIGVMTNQTASDIVKDAQANKINEIRDSLSSNTKRRIFDKVSAETRRNNGVINGNAEVIKALKTIKNKEEFFGQLNRINKQVNQNQVRISLAGDGKLLVNNNYKHTVSSVYELGRDGRNQLFARYGAANVTTQNAPTRVYSSCATNNSFSQACKRAGVAIEDISQIVMFLSQLQAKDQDIILNVLSQISGKYHDVLLGMSAQLIASLVPGEISLISNTFGDYKIHIVLFVLQYLKKRIAEMIPERDYENDRAIILVLKSLIHDGAIDADTLLVLKNRLLNIVTEFPNIKDFRDKGDEYDFIFKYQGSYCRTLGSLRAGDEIEAGPHRILLIPSTIDKIDELFEEFTQETCDAIMALTIRIISILDASEIEKLIEVNPDEDIVVRVTYFLLKETNIVDSAGNCTEVADIMDKKTQLLRWRQRQIIRSRIVCHTCNGYTYTSVRPIIFDPIVMGLAWATVGDIFGAELRAVMGDRYGAELSIHAVAYRNIFQPGWQDRL